MKKILPIVSLALPAILSAQLGGLLNAPKLNTSNVDNFVKEVDAFEVRVDTATNLLYTATDIFFVSVDSFKTLPPMEKMWNDVKTDIKNAATDEMKTAAQQGYLKYAQNITSRKDKLDEIWQDNTVRNELLGYLIGRKEMLNIVKDSLLKAIEIDEKAVMDYEAIVSKGTTAVTDLTNQIAANPMSIASAKPVLDKGKTALSSIAEIKKDVEEHIKLAKYIVEKIKEALGG
ncbi:hypothetical protein GX441_06250 [bacterium]|nr:hypothetical protein [bacterium]